MWKRMEVPDLIHIVFPVRSLPVSQRTINDVLKTSDTCVWLSRMPDHLRALTTYEELEVPTLIDQAPDTKAATLDHQDEDTGVLARVDPATLMVFAPGNITTINGQLVWMGAGSGARMPAVRPLNERTHVYMEAATQYGAFLELVHVPGRERTFLNPHGKVPESSACSNTQPTTALSFDVPQVPARTFSGQIALWFNSFLSLLAPTLPLSQSMHLGSCVWMGTKYGPNPPIHKLDLILVKAGENQGGWSSVMALCNVLPQLSLLEDGLREIWRDALMMFRGQPDRRYIICLLLHGTQFRLCLVDRAGMAYSEEYSLNHHRSVLARILTGTLLGSPRWLGYDTTATHSSYGLPQTLQISEDIYCLKEIIYLSPNAADSRTTCWLALDDRDAETEVVIKETWMTREAWSRATQLYNRLSKTTSYYPQIVHHEVVRIDREEDQMLPHVTGHLFCGDDEPEDCPPIVVVNRLWESQKMTPDALLTGRSEDPAPRAVCHADTLLHCRIVLSPVGAPLTHFSTKQELVQAVIDIVEAHRSLYELGFLHGDLCRGNMLLSPGPDGRRRGLLVDLEGAIPVDATISNEATALWHPHVHQTDAVASLAIQSLQFLSEGEGGTSDGYTHTIAHDLESILHVFLWICINRSGPGNKRRIVEDERRWAVVNPTARWTTSRDPGSLWATKYPQFSSMETTLLPFFDPYFNDMKGLIKSLYMTLFPHDIVQGYFAGVRATHADITRCLQAWYAHLEEPNLAALNNLRHDQWKMIMQEPRGV